MRPVDKGFAFEIDPNTIRQCTEVRDSNNELIFEKDIVTFSYEKDLRGNDKRTFYRGTVIYWEIECRFMIKDEVTSRYYPLRQGAKDFTRQKEEGEAI